MTAVAPSRLPERGLRVRKRRELGGRLVAIAGRRFIEQGHDATNMREIAQ